MQLLDRLEDLVRQAEQRDPREGPLMVHVGSEVEDALAAELGHAPATIGGHKVNPFRHSVPESDTVIIEGWPYKTRGAGGECTEVFFAVRLPIGLNPAEAETYLRLRADGLQPDLARGAAIALERD